MIKEKSIFQQFLDYNFATNEVYLKDNDDYSKKTKKKLMSFSSFGSYLNTLVFDGIPKWILDNSKEFGTQVMTSMGIILEQKDTIKTFNDIDDYCFNSDVSDCCKEILRLISERKFRLRAVDKWVTNGYWKGIIDFVIKKSTKSSNRTDTMPLIVEFKTRNSDEVRKTDYLQLAIYKAIVEPFCLQARKDITIPAEVWVYNKKTKKISTYQMNKVIYRECLTLLNNILKTYGLDKYTLNFKTQHFTDEELELNYGIKRYNTTFNTRRKNK